MYLSSNVIGVENYLPNTYYHVDEIHAAMFNYS